MKLTIDLPMSFDDWVFLQTLAPKQPSGTVTVTVSEPAPTPVVADEPKPVTHADLRAACRAAREAGVDVAKITACMGAAKVDDVLPTNLGTVVALVRGLKP